MITIKQIQNNATVTDGSDTVTLGAGDSYTCSPPVINEYMELVIDTTISGGTASDSFSLNVQGNGVVDWGEGAGDEPYSSNATTQSADNTHQYAVGGVYTVRFKGGYSQFVGVDRAKMLELKNYGTWARFNVFYTFAESPDLVVSAIDTLRNTATNLGYIFYNSYNVTNISYIDTYRATSVTNLVKGTKLDQNIGYMDLRNCTNFVNFARGVTTWSTENYGNTLLGWLRWDSTTHAPAVGWVLQSNQNFHGGNSTLVTGSEAALVRDYLINTLNWTITDGGLT